MKLALTIALLGTFSVLAAAGEPVVVSAEDRKGILQALRPMVERQLGGPVEFVVATLRSDGTWAFVQAEPQRPGGGRIDGRRYFADEWSNMDGLTTTAILQRRSRGWVVVEWRTGATDAWYCGPLPRVAYDPCRP